MLIGTQAQFLSKDYTHHPYGEKSRLQFLWEQNTKWGITLKIKDAWNQRVLRENDLFLMDKICEKIPSHLVLNKLNDVRLWLKVSRLSDIVIEDRTDIAPLPTRSELKWPKRRKSLPENLKLWRDTLRNIFCGAAGPYTMTLGPISRPLVNRNLLEGTYGTCHAIICQFPEKYKKLLGIHLLGDAQLNEIIMLLKNGDLYAGSEGSSKNGIGSHAYGFTSGKYTSTVWGGAAITPGAAEDMSSLRAKHGGAIGILLILYTIQTFMGNNMQFTK